MTANGARLLSKAVAASGSPVTLAQAKAHCRVDSSAEDDLFDLYIATATRSVEERAGRVLMTVTWGESFRDPTKRVILSKSPAKTLVSVAYYDVDNSLQTATLSDFSLVPLDVDAYVESDNWPAAYDRADAYTIQYTAGETEVIATLRHAVLLIVALYHQHRLSADDVKVHNIPEGVEALINLEASKWYG
jgi:uncharacterized phiE125 gp8 family phage protein